MIQKLNKILVFLTVIAVVLTSAITTKPVHADDGITGGTPEPVVVEETPPAEAVAEIIEQLPEGTEIVVVSEDGIEPLASEEAAQIIMQDDPLWCPAGYTPGDPECTSGDLSVTDLLVAISLLPEANRTGAGTIYFTSNYSLPDAVFDHDNAALSLITDLTIEGGWNGEVDGLFSLAGSSTFNGAQLAILNWGGNVTLNNITINNVVGDTGLYVGTDGDIVLNNVSSTNNGFDGADLINYEGTGNVTVNGGDFSGNDDSGLYIISAGNVTVNSATASNNNNGAIIFNDDGSGNVSVSGSDFNNNTWTGIEVTSNGDITLDDVDASNNSVGGAYLNALGGSGNIFVQNTSQFNSNGQYGLHAFAKGDIALDNVTVNGDSNPDPLVTTPVTDGGAWLKSFDGNVSVSNSLFTNNLDYGLLAVAAVGPVSLVNVTSTFNGGNGVEVYSIYSFACFGDDNILIEVTSGVYSDNGGYGIYAYPGELGSLVLNGPIFSDNLGETFVEALSNPCPEPEPKPIPDGDGKEPNVIDVPEDGQSGPVEQDCELYSRTVFQLHSGTTVKVDCPFEGDSNVIDTPQGELPDSLPVGLTFADAVTVGLDSEGNPISVLDDGLITLNFHIPEELMGKRLSILYWDPTAKDGQGDWIELPFDQFGGAYFPLYPDNEDDGRLLCSGFKQSGDTVSVTVNFPGTFVLVAR